jgi:transcriptional regulator with XRE-family HTH domain
MKRTPEDDVFVEEFARELRRAYEATREKDSGVTDEIFATSIGVKRPQLTKYLRGEAMPSLRTVALAYRTYGISVPYEQVPAKKLITVAKSRKGKFTQEPLQLVLPFTIRSHHYGECEVQLTPIRSKRYELRIRMNRVS